MIPALLLGRKGSVGFPGKNLAPLLGRPVALYPMLAALHSKSVDAVYISTDDERLMELARNNGVEVIKRPEHLCTSDALGEEAFLHGYNEIKKRKTNAEISIIVLLFCNAPTLLSKYIDEGIDILMNHTEYDSVVTVSQYNWYSPSRARRIGPDGMIHPFIPFDIYDNKDEITCDRNSQGDCYYADVCVSVVRDYCLKNLDYGILPQKWMGRKIFPILNWGGLDIDVEWQMPQAEYWLRKHGFSVGRTIYND